MDLPSIVDRFAEDFDSLPAAFPGRLDYRALVVTGSLVASAIVIGQLIGDDTIVLMGIAVDLEWPQDEEPR